MLLICSTLIPCPLILLQYLTVHSHVLVLVLTCFIVTQIEEELSSLLTDAGSDADTTSRHSKFTVLSICSQIINMYTELSRILLQHSWTILRNSAKLLSILYNIFTHLASKVSLSQSQSDFWHLLAMVVDIHNEGSLFYDMKYASVKLRSP